MLTAGWLLLLPGTTIVVCIIWNVAGCDKKGQIGEEYSVVNNGGDTSAEQRSVAMGMGCALLSAALSIALVIPYLFELPIDMSTLCGTATGRLAVTLKWQSLIILPLFFGIARIATLRFFGDQESLRGEATQAVSQHSKYLQNTLEQVALAFPAQLILSVYLSADNMIYIPALTTFFLFARVLFWQGYVKHPDNAGGRSYGFALTFYPTVATVLADVILLIMELV